MTDEIEERIVELQLRAASKGTGKKQQTSKFSRLKSLISTKVIVSIGFVLFLAILARYLGSRTRFALYHGPLPVIYPRNFKKLLDAYLTPSPQGGPLVLLGGHSFDNTRLAYEFVHEARNQGRLVLLFDGAKWNKGDFVNYFQRSIHSSVLSIEYKPFRKAAIISTLKLFSANKSAMIPLIKKEPLRKLSGLLEQSIAENSENQTLALINFASKLSVFEEALQPMVVITNAERFFRSWDNKEFMEALFSLFQNRIIIGLKVQPQNIVFQFYWELGHLLHNERLYEVDGVSLEEARETLTRQYNVFNTEQVKHIFNEHLYGNRVPEYYFAAANDYSLMGQSFQKTTSYF